MIAGRKAQRLVDVSFGFSASTNKVLRVPDASMSPSQVSIQRQCVLAISDALPRPLRAHVEVAQPSVGKSVVRREGQRFGQKHLSCGKPFPPFVGQKDTYG